MKVEIDRYTCNGCGKVQEMKRGEKESELFFSCGWFAVLESEKGKQHACSRDCHNKLSNRMTGK